MPRRAKTGLQPLHLAAIAGFIGVIAIIGYLLVNHKSDNNNFGGTTELSVSEYLDNSNALSNNSYKFEGVIGERMENWPSGRGRLFSVSIDDSGRSTPVPVLIPSKFNGLNIQRGERFRFKVTVQAETGLLEATDIGKT